MKTFRSIIFWMHLAAGLIAGAAIGIMCFTGTALAFENELVAWAERDARRVTPPAPDAARLPLGDLLKKVREAQPEARPAGIVVAANPREAVAFTLGREGALYANPYTGEIRTPASAAMRDFMRLMTDWHRYLARSGDNRAIGKAINGACNIAFFVLAVSGLYLWIPRTWSWRGVKAIALFNFKFSGKARDFNWHNTIGLWSAPVLIVLTLTALPISYRWAGNLIYSLAGEEAPVQGGPGAGAAPAIDIPKPPEGTRPLSQDALLVTAQKLSPGWETITLRLGGGFGGRGSGGPRPAGETPRSEPRAERNPEARPAASPATVTVKVPGSWPRTATTTLTLNPYTGEELKREGFGDFSTGRQIRTWTRFLHTGQALGWGGQFIAGLACLGGCFLVYTGFALSWRRFFFKKKSAPNAG